MTIGNNAQEPLQNNFVKLFSKILRARLFWKQKRQSCWSRSLFGFYKRL